MAPRRWHSFVGIVVLTAGLFLGGAGGGIAAAHPDSSGSTAGESTDSGAGDSDRADDTSAIDHTGTTDDGTRTADETSGFDEPAPDEDEDEADTSGSSSWDVWSEPPVDADLSATTSDSDSAATSSDSTGDGTAPLTDTSPAAEPAPAPVSEPVTPAVEPAIAPPPQVEASAPVSVPVADPPAPAAAPMTTSVPPPPQAIPPVPYPVLLPPAYIWVLENIVDPVVATVERLLQLPGDLYRALVSLLGAQPSTAGLPDLALGGGLSPDVASFMTSPLALLLLPHLDSFTVPAPGAGPVGVVPAATDMLALLSHPQNVTGAPAEPPGMVAAPSAPAAGSWLENAIERIDDIAVPASLAVLAATALPGIGGILVLTAVGIRLGYRQARAGIAVRVSAVARFLEPEHGGSGPGAVVTFPRWRPRAGPPDGAPESIALGRAA